jgi:hypothetical protein
LQTAKWHSRHDSHLHLRRSKRRALVIKLREHEIFREEERKSSSPVRASSATEPLNYFSVSLLPPSTDSPIAAAMKPPAEIGGSPRCCPVLCGLRDRCITAMLATHRDTKAELNHRGQACEVLAGTGISRRRKWSERGVTLSLVPAPEAGASLLGYALINSPAR